MGGGVFQENCTYRFNAGIGPVCSPSGSNNAFWSRGWKAFHQNTVAAQFSMDGCIYRRTKFRHLASISQTEFQIPRRVAYVCRGSSFCFCFLFFPFQGCQEYRGGQPLSPSASWAWGWGLVSSQRRVLSPRRPTKIYQCPL